jgi:carboxymethylenebutenolidase
MSTENTIVTNLQITMPNGRPADAVLCHPQGDASAHPGVLHLTDIGGIRPAQILMVQQLAAAGYTVLMPNLFHRTSRPPVLERGLPQDIAKARIAELTTPLTPEVITSDSAVYLDFLAKYSRETPFSVVGYCYSGSLALRIAAAHSDRIQAAASFHGSGLYEEGSPSSAHLVLPQVKARLYFGYAVKDPFMPDASVAAFDRALNAWAGKFESEVYEGAYHSWTAPDSPLHNADQAARAFQKLIGMLPVTGSLRNP